MKTGRPSWPAETKENTIPPQATQDEVLDDEIEIATWISDVRRVSAMRHYTITRVRDGVLLARVNSLGVWLNLATGQPARFPAELLADFAPNTVAGGWPNETQRGC